MKASQRVRVIEALRNERPRPVCGNVFLQMHMPRYAAVIWTLRHKGGFVIESEDCNMHNHEGGVAMYRLVHEPAGARPQEQLTWL